MLFLDLRFLLLEFMMIMIGVTTTKTNTIRTKKLENKCFWTLFKNLRTQKGVESMKELIKITWLKILIHLC